LKIEKKERREILLSSDEPTPFVILNPDSVVPLLLVCDHASNRFPQSLGSMGLDYPDRVSHMTLDIGAGAIAEVLADKLGATAVLSQYSRLIVDCNRELSDNSVFLENSEGIDIPGNQNLSSSEKERRISEIYWPYHNAIEAQICRLRDQDINPLIISIHSFTPFMNGKDREWEMGVLWDKDQTTAEFFLNKLTDTGFLVGDNEPYSGKAPEDFTIDYHAEPIGLAHVGIEIRQDLIDHGEGVERISDTLHEVISALTASTRKIDIEKRRSLR